MYPVLSQEQGFPFFSYRAQKRSRVTPEMAECGVFGPLHGGYGFGAATVEGRAPDQMDGPRAACGMRGFFENDHV